MNEHPAEDAILRYLAELEGGAMLGRRRDSWDSAALEAHVDACPPCAGRLRAAACVEVAMYEVARQMDTKKRVRQSGRQSVLSAALTLALLLLPDVPTRLSSDRSPPDGGMVRVDLAVETAGTCLPPGDPDGVIPCEDASLLTLASEPEETSSLEPDVCVVAGDDTDLVCTLDEPLAG